jgi:hypothetical protein
MKEPPVSTSRELIERFGRTVVENYNSALRQLSRSLGDSNVPADQQLRAFLASLAKQEREMKIAHAALETFIDDFMASLDESDDFKVMGTLKDGTQFDLRDLCPEGLHGNQLDWIEDFAGHKSVYETIFEKDFLDKS